MSKGARFRNWRLGIGLLCLVFAAMAARGVIAPQMDIVQQGQWLQGPPALTGGDYHYRLTFNLASPGQLVVDFKHSSVLATYTHTLTDAAGKTLLQRTGGLHHPGPGDFFLRHGQRLELPPGQYHLDTRISSPFYLATPTPFVFSESQYRQYLLWSQSLTLLGMGIFLALSFYFLVIGLWRRDLTDLFYAAFIVGNLLYNGAALLVFRDLFGWQNIYLVSVPILFSNAAYVAFVLLLLGINRQTTPRLFGLGIAALLLLASFWPLAWLAPHWSLELARFGVAIFALYGLLAAISQSLARNRVAWFYLIANGAFVVPALLSISLRDMPLTEGLLIEHLGMVAVLIEVLLLAQVVSYQIGQVYRERTRHQLAAEEGKLLANLTAQVPGVIYQFRLSADGQFSAPYASRGLRDIFALDPEDVREDATPALNRVCAEDHAAFMASIYHSAQTMTPWTHEFRVVLPGRGLRWRTGNSTPEKQPDGSIVWHGFITDITNRKLIEEQMQHMAQHDLLTDLPNRALFMDRFNQALERQRREQGMLALMFIDLDDFKLVNDKHGHQVGDALLQALAQTLRQSLRASDTAARLGGDEFVILLHPVSTRDDALRVAGKIHHACVQPHRIDGLDITISCSIGIALFPVDATTPEGLIKAADTAMYQCKDDPHTPIHFYSPGNG